MQRRSPIRRVTQVERCKVDQSEMRSRKATHLIQGGDWDATGRSPWAASPGPGSKGARRTLAA